jgi:hypothetical protein
MPASESANQERDLARWYEFFRDNCTAAARRGMGIATGPDNKAALQDMMERVYEDELWPKGVDLPPLLVSSNIEPGTYQFVEPETLVLLNAEAAMKSATGLGRFKTLYTPEEALKRRDA